jgi:hypothetical protein
MGSLKAHGPPVVVLARLMALAARVEPATTGCNALAVLPHGQRLLAPRTWGCIELTILGGSNQSPNAWTVQVHSCYNALHWLALHSRRGTPRQPVSGVLPPWPVRSGDGPTWYGLCQAKRG